MKTLTLILTLFSLISYGQIYHTPQAKLEAELNDLAIKNYIIDCYADHKVKPLPKMYSPGKTDREADSVALKSLAKGKGCQSFKGYKLDRDQPLQTDTSKVIMLVCDTGYIEKYYSSPAYWIHGYEVLEKYWIKVADSLIIPDEKAGTYLLLLSENCKE